jgi:hypothetical protein
MIKFIVKPLENTCSTRTMNIKKHNIRISFYFIFKYIVQRWLQTIKLDEHYQTDLKMFL